MKKKFLSIIYAAVMAISGTFVAIGREYKNFNKSASVEKAPVAENVIVKETENQNMSLKTTKILPEEYVKYDVAPLAETAYTLSAVMTPSNATDQTVDWTVAWVNPESGWAQGKTVTDYVNISPQSDGALVATLSCLKAFGEQVTVTVTARSNAELTAACSVDYVKKILSVDFQLYSFIDETFNPTWTPIEEVIIMEGTSSCGGLVGVPSVTFSVGTISETFEYTHNFAIYDWVFDRIRALNESGGIDVSETALRSKFSKERSGTSSFESDMKVEMYQKTEDFLLNAYNLRGVLFGIDPSDPFINTNISYEELNTAYVNCVTENPELAYYEFTMTGQYSSYTGTFPVRFNQNEFYTGAKSLTLNMTEILF